MEQCQMTPVNFPFHQRSLGLFQRAKRRDKESYNLMDVPPRFMYVPSGLAQTGDL